MAEDHVEEALSGRCAIEESGWLLLDNLHTSEPFTGTQDLESIDHLPLCIEMSTTVKNLEYTLRLLRVQILADFENNGFNVY